MWRELKDQNLTKKSISGLAFLPLEILQFLKAGISLHTHYIFTPRAENNDNCYVVNAGSGSVLSLTLKRCYMMQNVKLVSKNFPFFHEKHFR